MTSLKEGEISWFGAFLVTLVASVLSVISLCLLSGISMLVLNQSMLEATQGVFGNPVNLAIGQILGLLIASWITLEAIHNTPDLKPTFAVIRTSDLVVILALISGIALQFVLQDAMNYGRDLFPHLIPPNLQSEPMRRFIRIDSWDKSLVVPMVLVVIPALSEELFFRGLLFGGLQKRHGCRIAWLETSLLFAVMHVHPTAMIYAFIAGLILGWVRMTTSSTLPCIALHGACNATPILFAPEILPIPGFNQTGTTDSYLDSNLLLLALCTLIATQILIHIKSKPA